MSCVLVVDDSVEKLKGLERAAAAEGRVVLSASARDEAERILRERDIDLVVTDLALHSKSDTDGLDVLRKAAAMNIPVIVVSAYFTPANAREAMKLGAFDLIDRGTDVWEPHAMLREKIALALRYGRALRQALQPVHAPAQ